MVATATGPRLVGRTAERGALFDAWERATAGLGAAVVVTGEAGIGKSRLVAELADAVRSSRGRVLSGACSSLGEGAMPYAPLLEALHGVRGSSRLRLLDLVATRPAREAGEPISDPMGQARIFAAILDRLEVVSRRQPTVLILEDLHWAKSSTLDLVAFLVRNLPRGLLPVLTIRSDSPGARLSRLVAELTRLPGTERVDLRPLDLDDLTALLAGILEAPPNPRLAAEIHARSDGNPFLAEELLAAVVRGEATDLPARLRSILLARVGELSGPAITLLRAAAVLGHPSDRVRLRRVSRLPSVAFTGALAYLAEQALLVADAGDNPSWWFRHDLMREAVYAAIPAAERRSLHGNAARAVTRGRHPERMGVDAEIAEHWLLADRRELAIPHLTRAGDAALLLFAYDEAVGWYRRAISALEEPGAAESDASRQLAGLLARLAEALAMEGDSVGAEAAGMRAGALLDAAGEDIEAFLLRSRRAHWLWLNGQEAAATRIWDALRTVPITPQMAASPQVLAVLARLTHLDESATYAADAVASAQAAGLPEVEADAQIWLGMSLAQTGRVDDGLAALRRATSLAAAERNVDLYRYASHLLVAVLGEAERFSEAVEAGEEQMRFLDGLRLEPRLREPILINYRDTLAWLGRWDQVMADVETALRTDQHESTRASLFLLRAQIALARGEWRRAASDVEEAARLGRGQIQESHLGSIALLRAHLAMIEGRLEAAAALVEAGLDAIEATEDMREDMFHDLVLLGMRIEVARAGRTARGQRLESTPRRRAAALLGRLRRRRAWRRPRYTLFVRQIATTFLQARAEGRRVAQRDSIELWSRAADGWGELQRPAVEAYARMCLGESLAVVGDPSAGQVLAGAYRVAASLGARPLMEDIETIARRGGIPLGALTQEGLASRYGLTPREREVLAAVTRGWSNKEIAVALGISEKTAEVHVSHVLRKLGVDRRVEAAMLALQGGLVDPPPVPLAAWAPVPQSQPS